jgi:dienelactone hydrolase
LHSWIPLAALLLAAGCSDNGNYASVTGPDFPTGAGRVYNIQPVVFNTVDGVFVSASYGRAGADGPLPTVILVHEVGIAAARQEWFSSRVFEALLETGYNVLALDLRGHGSTSMPADGREQDVLLVTDLEDMHLEVRAAITWLRTQASTDNARIGVIGNGIGGNIAYVSMGAFPDDLQVGIALSPGFWDQERGPLVVGDGIEPFDPHSILYVVGETDFAPLSETESLSYAVFASALALITVDPSLQIFTGVSTHGLGLLQTPNTLQLMLAWLQDHL